jgi:hypothetical protein
MLEPSGGLQKSLRVRLIEGKFASNRDDEDINVVKVGLKVRL